jgi:WD40 repeat protein
MTYDGNYIFAMDNTSVKQWDAAENRVINVFEGQTEVKDFCINTHYDRLVLACGKDGIASFDVKTGQRYIHRDMKYENGGKGNPYSGCVCFMPNDQYILSGSEDILMFWNIDDNRIMGIIPCESTITLMDISIDGKYIAVLTDIGAELWRCDYNYNFPDAGVCMTCRECQPYMKI